MGSQVMLVFIPTPGAGHLGSILEFAKLLVAQEHRLSITVLLLKRPLPNSSNPTAESLSSSTVSDRIHFVDLPQDVVDPARQTMLFFLGSFYESQRHHVRAAVAKIAASAGQRLAGFVLDMFCHPMTDVADEFGVPSYFFFTSNCAFLSLAFHLQDIHDEGRESCLNSESVEVPGFRNPIPAKVIPTVLTDKDLAPLFKNLIKKFRRAKGILVNTFPELESGTIEALSSWGGKPVPPIYPVGPLISLSPGEAHAQFADEDRTEEIVTWLDRQPPSSVLFLCFGSMGSFKADQVREIAVALERSGIRFLWSLRRPPLEGGSPVPREYGDSKEVLPEGFIDRTSGIGKVIGWAPQVTVLAHPAVGGFVSHCGWNSTLESIWHGVPLATWPLYAEQQLNAFVIVKEEGLAVEITLDYRKDFGSSEEEIVESDKIEKGIRSLMENGSEATRKRVKAVSGYCRKALLDGGSSFTSLCRFINEVLEEEPPV